MFTSAKANLKAEVAGSYLNWLWWVLEPLGMMIMYAIIFGWLFQNSIEYFPVFIFSGNLIWGFFNTVSSASVSIIKANEMLVSKVYLPKYILLIEKMLIEGFKLLISFGLTVFLMIIFGVPFTLKILWIIPVLLVLFVNVFGIGMVLLNCGVFFEDLGYAIRIVMMVWMYFSGIFYDIRTMVPSPYSEILLTFNGPAFFIDSFRNALLFGAAPNIVKLMLWFIVGVVLAFFGVLIVKKHENDYVKRM